MTRLVTSLRTAPTSVVEVEEGDEESETTLMWSATDAVVMATSLETAKQTPHDE